MNENKSLTENLIEYYSQGYSDAEVAAALKITLRDFNKQLSDNTGFNKLVEYGRTLSVAFWESLARKNVNNKQFNSPLYSFYMKNKHGWADKVETNAVNENTNISLDQLQTEIARKLKEIKGVYGKEITDAEAVMRPVIQKEQDEAA